MAGYIKVSIPIDLSTDQGPRGVRPSSAWYRLTVHSQSTATDSCQQEEKMVLCFRPNLSGPYDATALWDDRKLVLTAGFRSEWGLPIAECFDGTPRVNVIRKKQPALTWLNVGYVVLAVGRLKRIIEQYANDAIEFIPVETLFRSSGKDEPVTWPDDDRFFVINPLNIVECVDESKSIFAKGGGKNYIDGKISYSDFEFMYFIEDRIQGLNIFRVLGLESYLFMSEELVLDLKKSGSLGAHWQPPEEMFRPPELFPQLWHGRQRRSD